MVPEMLDIEVPESMMSQKPANYTSYTKHLEEVQETRARFEKERADKAANRKAKRGPDRSRQFKMDVSQTVDNTGVSAGVAVTEHMEHQTVPSENIT